jgi:hypothetical protein
VDKLNLDFEGKDSWVPALPVSHCVTLTRMPPLSASIPSSVKWKR